MHRFKEGFFGSFVVLYTTLPHIGYPSDSTDFCRKMHAGIEPMTVATLTLTVRHSYHSSRSHPRIVT